MSSRQYTESMSGQDVVTTPQSAQLSKHCKHPEVKLGLHGETACQKVDNRGRSSLMESEKSLHVYFMVLANDILLLGGQHKGGKSREKDRDSKHCLNPDGGSRVCPVPLTKTSMEDSIHCSPVS